MKLTINDQSFHKGAEFLETTLFLLNLVFTNRRLLLFNNLSQDLSTILTIWTERYVDIYRYFYEM